MLIIEQMQNIEKYVKNIEFTKIKLLNTNNIIVIKKFMLQYEMRRAFANMRNIIQDNCELLLLLT